MKIFDEQGRLFGKINLIDFICLVFALWIVFALCAYSFISRKKSTVPSANEEEYKRLQKLDIHIKEFLKEHKAARRYFE